MSTAATDTAGTVWLLVRRGGGLWGVPRECLHEVPRGEPLRIRLRRGTEVVVDEVLGLTSQLAVRPVPRAAAPYLKVKLRGFSVWRGEPLLLLAPDTLPANCVVADLSGYEGGDLETASDAREAG